MHNDLIPSQTSVLLSNGQFIRVMGYKLPGYEIFDLRQFEDIWILSLNGKLITFGSLWHCEDCIHLIANSDINCQTVSNVVYWLTCPEYKHIFVQILELRRKDNLVCQVS